MKGLERSSESSEPPRRKFLKQAALATAGLAAGVLGTNVWKAHELKEAESKEIEEAMSESGAHEFQRTLPSREGLIQKSPLSWISEDAVEFLEDNKERMSFDYETGSITVDLSGNQNVSGKVEKVFPAVDKTKCKEVRVATGSLDGDFRTAIFFFFPDIHGQGGDIVAVVRNENGALEPQKEAFR